MGVYMGVWDFCSREHCAGKGREDKEKQLRWGEWRSTCQSSSTERTFGQWQPIEWDCRLTLHRCPVTTPWRDKGRGGWMNGWGRGKKMNIVERRKAEWGGKHIILPAHTFPASQSVRTCHHYIKELVLLTPKANIFQAEKQFMSIYVSSSPLSNTFAHHSLCCVPVVLRSCWKCQKLQNPQHFSPRNFGWGILNLFKETFNTLLLMLAFQHLEPSM